jgi:TonB family protein
MDHPRAWSRRTVAAATVAVLHVALFWAFIRGAEVHGGSTRSGVLQVVLVVPDETRPPEPPPEPPLSEVPPEFTTPMPAPADDAPAHAASFMALTVPHRGEGRAETDGPVPVVDAIGFDTGVLRDRCIRAYPDTAPDLEVDGTVTLLVKVEPSGRPSETQIAVSSGSSQLDEAVGACLLSLGALEPVIVNGLAVRTWQRVIWRRRMTP